jgi:dextranase
MRILDFYPARGCFSAGETISLLVEIDAPITQTIQLQLEIQHLAEPPVSLERTCRFSPGWQIVRMEWVPPADPAGYSARLWVCPVDGPRAFARSTSFDILPSWTDFPRYGFLADFSASRADPEATLRKLARYHINGLQFYDWQYRHDRLLAPTEEYLDPLGRAMSLASVRKLVDAAHRLGMAALPYLAIYAASAEFWRAHPNWALYDEAGNPIPFGENFLGLMDPSRGSPWSRHLLDEGGRVLKELPFDGLHIDQYGEPKLAWNAQHQLVDLPGAFVDFIQSASDQQPGRVILFNAVGNWPIEALAESAVNFLYIEVWPPDVEYRHLANIVLNAVRLSRGKAVVIALYLPASRPANNLLADAVIMACGGTRIELGEDACLLSDPYFPKHEKIQPYLQSELRRLADFAVRNGEWVMPYALPPAERERWSRGEWNPPSVSIDESIWVVVRRYPQTLSVQLINFNGLDPHQRWDESHAAPTIRENVIVKIQMHHPPSHVRWDVPEQTQGPRELSFEHNEAILIFQIPQIHFIGLITVHE